MNQEDPWEIFASLKMKKKIKTTISGHEFLEILSSHFHFFGKFFQDFS